MPNSTDTEPAQFSVFLSYASEDREAARFIRDALPALGLAVWYDESDLGGGEAWDQKIRRQIRECDYFMPVISARTQARAEGYFRREWRLAVERTLDMADDRTFLLPVVIDDTDQAVARVPEKFLMVQWLRLPDGKPTPALEALCKRLAAGAMDAPRPRKAATGTSGPTDLGNADAGTAQAGTAQAGAVHASAVQAGTAPGSAGGQSSAEIPYPEFPRAEPGQRVRFWVHVMGWALRSAWLTFSRLPRWVRYAAIVWAVSVLLGRGCAVNRHHDSADDSAVKAQKLKTIVDQFSGTSKPADVTALGMQIAKEFAPDDADPDAKDDALLIPFATSSADVGTAQLVNSTFAEIYGQLAIAHSHARLAETPGAACDATAVKHERAKHAANILCGSIDSPPTGQALTIKIITAAGALRWSKVYPLAGADPARIAAEVVPNVPASDDN